MKIITLLLFTFQFTLAADQKAFIQSCVDAYNSSNQKNWYTCWDQDIAGKMWEAQAKKNGMTVDQLKTSGFQSMRAASGKVTLTKLIEDCEDDTMKKIAEMSGKKKQLKGLDKLKSMPTPHHYYYEASSENKGKLGLRFDIIEKAGAAKIMTYNYLVCSESPDCINHDRCPTKK